jgi:hypothetical protein
MHVECAELLLLLRDYLQASKQPQLADTACFMLGGVLSQQEHCLRQVHLKHWSVEALLHMDALVQLYTQLLGQVSLNGSIACLVSCLELSAHHTAAPISPGLTASVPLRQPDKAKHSYHCTCCLLWLLCSGCVPRSSKLAAHSAWRPDGHRKVGP